MKKALLLVAHGSRQEEANADLYHVVAEMKPLGQFDIVEAAFLEFAEPNIEEGGRRCVALGAEPVVYTQLDPSCGPKASQAVAKSVILRRPIQRGWGPGGVSVARLL